MATSQGELFLVTGATGAQGGAASRALLRSGHRVRAIVRDPRSASARSLADEGVEVLQGDFDDAASLDVATAGVSGVFSMQVPPTAADPEREVRTGRALIDAAHRAGVRTFVHTSVARAGDQADFVGWDEGRWAKAYWNSKSAVNEAVASRGFERFVILKPAFMMDNLLPPKATGMYPALEERGRLETALAPDTRLDWIAAQDVGAFAAAAFSDPGRFNGHVIDLATTSLTMKEVASKLSAATGKTVTAISLSEAEAVEHGINPGVASSQAWNNVEGYKVDLAATLAWGVPMTTFEKWLAEHKGELVIGLVALTGKTTAIHHISDVHPHDRGRADSPQGQAHAASADLTSYSSASAAISRSARNQ